MDKKFGPTNDFPQGKMRLDDKGGLQLGIANDKGKVLIRFGVPVDWIGLDPQGAVDFATTIIKHARQAAKEAGVPIVVQI